MNFFLKVLIVSAGISVLIRYGSPNLIIAPTGVNTLIAVLTPTFVLAIALLWRAKNHQSPD